MPDSYGNALPWEVPASAIGYGTGAGMTAPASFLGTGAGLSFGSSMPTAFDWSSLSSNGQVAGFNSGNEMFASQTAPAQSGNSFWGPNGFNIGSVGTMVQGAGALMNAYLGFKNYKLAKEQLGFQKDAFNANLNNSIQTYNTSLEDRIRGRTAAHEGKEGEVQAYLAKHSLHR